MSCYIIAEAGVNHNGDLGLALKLCEAAKHAGADAVKFQIFNPEKLVTKTAEKAKYQSENGKRSETQFQMLQRLSLSKDAFLKIRDYCREIGIHFLATAFDDESIDFLHDLGVEVAKVPSGEITNLPYLEKISKLWKRIFLSTGMASFSEIEEAYKVLSAFGAEVVVLHCTTEYPAPFDTVNLRAMKRLGDSLHTKYGYSDHTNGIEISIAAAAMGAAVIEKHFTLDKTFDGPDHKASIDIVELERLVNSVRHVEESLGSPEKIVNECEIRNRLVVRKSIVAKRRITKGEILTTDNITTKRPGTGISPMMWYEVLGTRAKKDFEEDDLIEI